jgi:hypothetical protein
MSIEFDENNSTNSRLFVSNLESHQSSKRTSFFIAIFVVSIVITAAILFNQSKAFSGSTPEEIERANQDFINSQKNYAQ